MLGFLWIIPLLPLTGFLVLSLSGKRLGRRTSSIIGVSSVALSAILAILEWISFTARFSGEGAFTLRLWSWIDIPGLSVNVGFYLDSLSMIFIFIITFVSFLIHLYSSYFMKDEEGLSRFFAWMNLFTASMLILVMAGNLLLLYLGWEGVGLCSYLLIGFWYKDPENGYAARKAFIVTRIGDTAMAVGLFFLYRAFGTLNIHDILQSAPVVWASGSADPKIAALLLLGGAVGKSAQLPLQTWLPDAMAGPSPVSALIHAATMVTAGVYLIARTNPIFMLAPSIMELVAIIGAVTLLIAGFSALVQEDIKRVLAYSTISQIGYMFLALGVGAWSAAVFHFFIHAFFKALLFLAAGVIIINLGHEHNMFKMGGLRKKMPVVFYTFLAGAASLSALPLITAGFFSKDLILSDVFSTEKGGTLLWLAGLTGAGLTALYTFRMVFITFFGDAKMEPEGKMSPLMAIPLIILAFLSVVGGYINVSSHHTFITFLNKSLPAFTGENPMGTDLILKTVSGITVIAGLLAAYFLYIKAPLTVYKWKQKPAGRFLYRFWHDGWKFDELYDTLFVHPVVRLAQINRNDFVDSIYDGLAALITFIHKGVLLSQNGKLRWYLALIVIGVIIGFTITVFL